MGLYQKHRPTNFKDIVGNQVTIKTLLGILGRDRKDIPRVYMFVGPYGSGKTTSGRIFAKELGCNPDFDIKEIDVGSNRSVEDADKLKAQIRNKPLKGNYKAYIIDEIQIAVKGSFQESLLKTLEDGAPDFVFFILCTTDPGKINKGIVSRAEQLIFSQLNTREIILVCKRILELENKTISMNALKEVAVKSGGTPRNAINILDGLIGLENESDQLEFVKGFQTEEEKVSGLVQALIHKKSFSKVIIPILEKLKEDPEKIRNAVLSYVNKVMLSGNHLEEVSFIIAAFENPFFYSKEAGLTNACYLLTKD